MNRYIAPKEVVCSFLDELHQLIDAPYFNIKKNFQLGGKHERKKNKDTMFELNIDEGDIVQELRKLTISNYNHTLPDDRNTSMPDFHVFFISNLCDKEIYVKVRIQKIEKILCLSFHFAEFSHGKMPYLK